MSVPTAAAPGSGVRPDTGHALVTVVAALTGASTLIAGVWAAGWPSEFAEMVRFPQHEHFVHDLGAFQIGLGLGLLLALIWRDALATTLAAFLVANSVHTYNHVIDLDLGGRAVDVWLLASLSVLLALAVWLRLRELGYVVGYVGSTTRPELAPFVGQKTVALTTYRRDGTPVATPVSLAVDGDRAVFRSFEKAGKTKRLRNDPTVQVAPSTGSGKPTGPAIRGTARRLSGDESRRAARLLRRKHPFLHAVLVPLSHRAGRAKTGRTVHFELVPTAERRLGQVAAGVSRATG